MPIRTTRFLVDAKTLEKGKFFTPAIMLYSEYVEQLLLLKHIELYYPQNIKKALDERKRIFELKDENQLTFGAILTIAKENIKDLKILDRCEWLKNVRNKIIAHPFFVITFDATNRQKLALYDESYHKKFIRRLYKFVRKRHKIFAVEQYLYYTAFSSRLEEESYKIEQLLLDDICQEVHKNVEAIESDLSIYCKPLGKYMKV